jgi:hypothetical protein
MWIRNNSICSLNLLTIGKLARKISIENITIEENYLYSSSAIIILE